MRDVGSLTEVQKQTVKDTPSWMNNQKLGRIMSIKAYQTVFQSFILQIGCLQESYSVNKIWGSSCFHQCLS